MAYIEEFTEGGVTNSTPDLEKLLADEYVLHMGTRNAGRKIPDESPDEVRQLFRKQCRSMCAIAANVGRAARSSGLHHLSFMKISWRSRS